MAPPPTIARRRLLQFLAASPLFAPGALAQTARSSDPMDWAPRDLARRSTSSTSSRS
jgi:hypothetical protein